MKNILKFLRAYFTPRTICYVLYVNKASLHTRKVSIIVLILQMDKTEVIEETSARLCWPHNDSMTP